VEVPVVAFRVRRSVLHREMAQHAALTCPGSSDHG
jgi:hypothetical protein